MYTNPNFKRKNKSLLKNIKRKIYTDKEDRELEALGRILNTNEENDVSLSQKMKEIFNFIEFYEHCINVFSKSS